MDYKYEEKKEWLSTLKGGICLYNALKQVKYLLNEAGAFQVGSLIIKTRMGYTWESHCVLDRIIELGLIKEVTQPTDDEDSLTEVVRNIRKERKWERRVFVKGEDFDILSSFSMS